MNAQNIAGISVYLIVDGVPCVAPITKESAQLFVGMLPAFQKGDQKVAQVLRLPQDVAEHVAAAGRALLEHVERAQAQKGQA